MKKALLFILILANISMLAFIFGNSFKDAEASTEQSKNITQKINDTLEAVNSSVRVTNSTVRSSAHFTEFLGLGVTSALLFWLIFGKVAGWEYFALSFGFPFVSCVFDELIQKIFSEGRSFQFSDIGIDTLGLALGAGTVTLTVYIIGRRRKGVK